jgi:ribose transport system substrate-binding protein
MVQTMTRAVLSAAILVGAAVAAGSCAAADDAKKLIETAAKTTDTSFCGTKPITLGVHDGFGINGWSRASMAAVRSEAAKCANVKQVPRIGQGDLQRSIGDVNGMVSQGVDAIAIIPDWGKSQLPSLRAATDAGVKTVPWAADPGGKDGEDYVQYLDWDEHGAGLAWAEWIAKAIHGEGNVVFLGGPAGNPVSAHELSGVVEALKKYPKITLLTGDKDWPVTNWDSALIQQNMTALLNKYPKIDAVINDSTASRVSAWSGPIRAPTSLWCRWPRSRPTASRASMRSRKPVIPTSRLARSPAATGSAVSRRARRSRLPRG